MENALPSAQSGKNASVQVFRALLFLSVFSIHVLGDLRICDPFRFMAIGVTSFFVLSGFLLMSRDSSNSEPCSFKACVDSFKKRIFRLYPLYIATTFFVFLLVAARGLYGGVFAQKVSGMLAPLALHSLLLQSWFVLKPSLILSLNVPSWYISTAAFLYFAFPFVKKLTIQMTGNGRRAMLFAALAVYKILLAAAAICIYEKTNDEGFYSGACYFFPLSRLADFWIGCLGGAIYRQSKGKVFLGNFGFGIAQVAAAAFAFFYFSIKWEGFPFWARAFFKSDIVRILQALLWVYFFVEGKGLLRFANVRPLVALGNLSAFAYLIHWPVWEIYNAAKSVFNLDSSAWNLPTRCAVALAELAATILLSLLWARLDKAVRQRKAAKRACACSPNESQNARG